MTKSSFQAHYAIGLPRNLKKLKLNPVELIDKIILAPNYPHGLASELLSLRGTPGTMINISQNEKFTESGVPSRALFSGEAATPGTYPEKSGKIYLLRVRVGGVHIYGILW
jgi:hypothetical protein